MAHYSRNYNSKRDPQRVKVYRAEYKVRELFPVCQTQDEVLSFVARVSEIAGESAPQVIFTKARSWAWGSSAGRWIKLPDSAATQQQGGASWAFNQCVIIHELAHVFAGGNHAHNGQFLETFLGLVDKVFGGDLAESLRAKMIAAGLKITETVSEDEQMEIIYRAREANEIAFQNANARGRARWTPEEDVMLEYLMMQGTLDWAASQFSGMRTAHSVNHRWTQVLSKKRRASGLSIANRTS